MGVPSGVRSPCLLHPSGLHSLAVFCLGSPSALFSGLRLHPAVPPLAFFSCWWLIPPFLSILALPSLEVALSLSSVRLGLGSFAVSWLLLSCPRPLSLGLGCLACFLLNCLFLATFGSGLALVLVNLLGASVESQFLRDGVLPLGRVCSVGCFLCVRFQS